MSRPSANGLTDHELIIMQIFWDESPLSITEVLERFPKRPKPAYTSLLSVVRTMEAKGYLAHEKSGKAHLFSPLLKSADYKQFEFRKVAHRLFKGDMLELAVTLVKDENLKDSEIRKLRKVLESL